MSGNQSVQQVQAQVFGAVLARGIVAAVIGAITVFWQAPQAVGATILTGAFLLLSGLAMGYLRMRLARLGLDRGAGLLIAALLPAIAGILLIVLPSAGLLVPVATTALVIAGVSEFVLGWRRRDEDALRPLTKDWRISGVILTVTGIILPLFTSLGAKAVVGVLGGGALILAVQLLLAGLSYRHDGLSPAANQA
ncbi:MAG: hypothetical protein HIU81_12010 [Acidobacteria bacterium]|nr:hypothetical protein [Acidobacteriota bacterium]